MAVAAALGALLIGCRPSDVLSVPPPSGVTASSAYQSQSGAELLLAQGRAQIFAGYAQGFPAVLGYSGLLGDEFEWTFFSEAANRANVDARITAGGDGYVEGGDGGLESLLGGRTTLLSALPWLEQYEPASGQSKVGEAFALIGYTELLIAEDYCAGIPLGRLLPGGGVQYGTPLTTDSLLATAEVDLDSAAAHAGGDPTITGLAQVGLARAELDRGQFAQATAALSGVPTSFVYNVELEPGAFTSGGPNAFNVYDEEAQGHTCGWLNVADGKGGNGLDYVSAQDPRLVLSTAVAVTCDAFYAGSADSVWYYPVKFGNPSTDIPLASGIEARLMEAEGDLNANQPGAWADALNALRADSGDTKVVFQAALPTDSTTGAIAATQVDVMFRERAFWLYGTGARLGDMRRLIRQYGRDQSTVFPVGPYPNANNPRLPAPLPSYGTDVSLTLPTASAGVSDPNPSYKGCLTSTKVA